MVLYTYTIYSVLFTNTCTWIFVERMHNNVNQLMHKASMLNKLHCTCSHNIVKNAKHWWNNKAWIISATCIGFIQGVFTPPRDWSPPLLPPRDLYFGTRRSPSLEQNHWCTCTCIYRQRERYARPSPYGSYNNVHVPSSLLILSQNS